MSTTTENKQLMTTTTQNEERTQMTTNTATTANAATKPRFTIKNKKFLKYNAIRDESKALQQQVAANRRAQSDLVMDKIRSLQAIGQSVYTKCTSGSTVPLGEYGWVFQNLQLKELGATNITFYVLQINRGYWVTDEEKTLTLDRDFLHMSDRDFAKLIRSKINAWKFAQRAEAQSKLDDEIIAAQKEVQAAQLAAEKAERKVEEIQGKLDARAKALAARALKKEQGAERAKSIASS